MTPEQIKEAREWFNDRVEYFAVKHPQQILHTETILKALDIVEKLMGEPSEGMFDKGEEELFHYGDAEDVFEAMRDQLLKECE